VWQVGQDGDEAIYLDPNTDLVIYKLDVPVKWAGHNLDELIPNAQCEIFKWARNGSDLSADEPHILEAGDQIFLRADAEVIEAMRNRLDSMQEQKS
jgi:hypothetical protein